MIHLKTLTIIAAFKSVIFSLPTSTQAMVHAAILSMSTHGAIAGMAAALSDVIATVNTFGRVTPVRLTTATICLVMALIGPVRATIGPITVITGDLVLASISASSTDTLYGVRLGASLKASSSGWGNCLPSPLCRRLVI